MDVEQAQARPPADRRRAGRPRSEGAQRAILQAAYAILVGNGLADFSIEAVAARSGVARTTIYRWWPTKGVLAIASFLANFRAKLVYEQTSSTAADFRRVVRSLAAALSGPAGRVAASVIAEAQSDPETRRLFIDQFSEPLRQETAALLGRGIEQGEFRPDLDIARLIDAEVGAVYLRLLLGQSLDPQWVDQLVDTLLRGCLCDGAGDPASGGESPRA